MPGLDTWDACARDLIAQRLAEARREALAAQLPRPTRRAGARLALLRPAWTSPLAHWLLRRLRVNHRRLLAARPLPVTDHLRLGPAAAAHSRDRALPLPASANPLQRPRVEWGVPLDPSPHEGAHAWRSS